MNNTYEAALKEAAQEHASAFSLRTTYPAYLILLFALAASFFVWQLVGDRVYSDNTNEFQKATNSVKSRFETSVAEHEQIVKSMQQLYESFPFVVRDVFELYGSIAPRSYTSIQSIGFAPYTPREDLGEFIFYARSERYYSFKIHPDDSLNPLASRDFYFPTYYLVPIDGNQNMLGYDLASNETIMDAITRARETRKITATPFFDLRKPDTTGFMMLAPVFNQESEESSAGIRRLNVNGNIFIEVLAEEFFRNAIGAGAASDTTIVFACIDRSPGGDGQLIFESANTSDYPSNYEALFTEEEPIRFADRDFVVRFKTVPEFGGAFRNNLPLLSFIGAIVTSILLFLFTLSITSSKARAQDLADRMTASQRRIVDSSNDMIGAMALDGSWRGINAAVRAILGYEPDEFVGRNQYEFTVEEDHDTMRSTIESANDDQRLHYEVRMRAKDGSEHWISWNSTISRSDGLVYCIGRDITERKKAEAEIRLKNKQVELARQFSVELEKYKTRFMEDVSFYFRTSLTGILGYMQLIKSNLYSSKEQEEEFFDIAHQSAEDLLSRVDEILDVAEVERMGSQVVPTEESLPIEETFKSLIANLKAKSDGALDLQLMTDESDAYRMRANREQLEGLLEEIIVAFTDGLERADIQINAQVNSFENVVEIQMLLSGNQLATSMIEIFKSSNDENLIEVLKDDCNDIVFRIASATSKIRMMNGSMIVDSLGEEGNVVLITLPCKKIPRVRQNSQA